MLVSLRLIRPQLLGSLGFGLPHGSRCLDAYESTSNTPLLQLNLRLRLTSRPQLHRSLRPLQPKVLGNLGFGRPHRICELTAYQNSSHTTPAAPQPSALTNPMVPRALYLPLCLPSSHLFFAQRYLIHVHDRHTLLKDVVYG